VLTIFLAGWRSEEESPWFYEGTTAELFRTVRVIGSQVVFVEPSPGHLINVAHIERIAEDQPEEIELVDRGVPASPMLGTKSCPHGYILGTCSQCAGSPPDVEAWQTRNQP
jgi:hypothetical protein